MADTNKFTRHYSGEAGSEYVRQRQANVDLIGYRIDVEFFLPYLRATDVVLDFGAGNGGPMLVVKDHVQCVEGVEINLAARALAEKAGCELYPSLAKCQSKGVSR